jgi:hypothetical protein
MTEMTRASGTHWALGVQARSAAVVVDISVTGGLDVLGRLLPRAARAGYNS